jgi:hypothetical protein
VYTSRIARQILQPNPPPNFCDKKEISAMAGTFTLFGKLPTELCLKIWEFAIPGPRVIYLDFVGCEDKTAHTVVEDEKHDGLSVSGPLEEGTTTAENADSDTLDEGIEQSPIGNTTVNDICQAVKRVRRQHRPGKPSRRRKKPQLSGPTALRRVCYPSAMSPARSHRNTTGRPSQHLTLQLEHTLTSIGTRSTFDMINFRHPVIITTNFYMK